MQFSWKRFTDHLHAYIRMSLLRINEQHTGADFAYNPVLNKVRISRPDSNLAIFVNGNL
jgi:hypothetical protein